jgi:isopentenyl-diphosphate delta-isomerase
MSTRIKARDYPDSTMRLVETVDQEGAIGPPVAIAEAHRRGMPHRAISVLIWNASRTKMLITRRAASKATWPGFWSNAVCSHPFPREAYAAAARRRLFEELRIHGAVAPAFLMYYGPVRCPVSGAFEHEMDHVFHSRMAQSVHIRPDPSEVSDLRWVGRSQMEALQRTGKVTPWFSIILRRVRWAK